MQYKYRCFCLLAILCVLLPCAALALGTLQIDGTSYTSADLAGDLSGTGWGWTASANSGQGELTLSGYNGEAIAATDGVLYLQLSGANIIESGAENLLMVSGTNTGLHVYGSDAATDSLTLRSTITITKFNSKIKGINVIIANSATIPFTLQDISLTLDMAQAKSAEVMPGVFYPNRFYGVSVEQTQQNASLLGIDMKMENAVITMSNPNGAINRTDFSFGMWANPYYSRIEAVFNTCNFNLSDFTNRGWYTGRDFASITSATYNNCTFDIHNAPMSGSAIGVHASADSSTGTASLTLNRPDGEVEAFLSAVYTRASKPTLTINHATLQGWQQDTTKITDPKVISVYDPATSAAYVVQSVGVKDVEYKSDDYYKLAAKLKFTADPLPTPTPQPTFTPEPAQNQFPQTGDASTPALYIVLGLTAAAALVAVLRKTAARRRR